LNILAWLGTGISAAVWEVVMIGLQVGLRPSLHKPCQLAFAARKAHADAECYGDAQKWCEFEKSKCRKRDRNFVAFPPNDGRPAFAASRPGLRHGFC